MYQTSFCTIFQFYNGYINPVKDGFVGSGASEVYDSIANDLFPGKPEKVVFGFCVSDCGPFNSDGDQAVAVMQEINSLYPCNGGVSCWELHLFLCLSCAQELSLTLIFS